MALSSILFAEDVQHLVARVKPGDGAYNFLKRYNVPTSDCNLNYFREINSLPDDLVLIADKTYKLPVIVYKYDGTSIRSTIGNNDLDLAKKIQAFNENLYEKGLRNDDYRTDNILWVPYDLLNCNPTSGNNTKVATKNTKTFPIFGEEHEEVTILDTKLTGNVYYIVAGHGDPDPGAMGKYKGHTLCEDEYAYDIALRMAKNLLEHNATVYMIVRDDDDGIRDGEILSSDNDEVHYKSKTIPINQIARLNQRCATINELYKENKQKGAKKQRAIILHLDSRGDKQRVDMFFYHSPKSKTGKKLAYFQFLGNYYYSRENPDSAIFYNSKGLDVARKTENSYYTAYFHLWNAINYNIKSEYETALNELTLATEVAAGTDSIRLQNTIARNTGNVYWGMGIYEKALGNYFMSLKISEDHHFYRDIASSLNNMGSCYIFKNRLDKTIEYYKKSIKIKQEINDRPELARTYNNLGAVYLELGEVDEALKYLHDALRINREIDSTREILHNLENITSCELARGRFDRADLFANDGLGIAREIADIPFQVSLLAGKGIAAVETADIGQANQLLSQANRLLEGLSEMTVEYLINRSMAQMYLTLHVPDRFRDWIDKARSMAVEIGDDRGLVVVESLSSAAALRFRDDIEEAEQHYQSAFREAQAININKIHFRLYLNKMAIALEKGEDCGEEDEKIAQYTGDPGNRILMAEYKHLCARQKILENDYESALEDLVEASGIAEKLGQKDILWRINHTQGIVEKNILNYEEAYLNFRKAVSIIKQIAETIDNRDYLKTFLNQPTALSLKKNIMELSERMGRK